MVAANVLKTVSVSVNLGLGKLPRMYFKGSDNEGVIRGKRILRDIYKKYFFLKDYPKTNEQEYK